jgi:hypothetical protein
MVLALGFYEEVWKVFSQLQYDSETLRMMVKLRRRVLYRAH